MSAAIKARLLNAALVVLGLLALLPVGVVVGQVAQALLGWLAK